MTAPPAAAEASASGSDDEAAEAAVGEALGISQFEAAATRVFGTEATLGIISEYMRDPLRSMVKLASSLNGYIAKRTASFTEVNMELIRVIDMKKVDSDYLSIYSSDEEMAREMVLTEERFLAGEDASDFPPSHWTIEEALGGKDYKDLLDRDDDK